MKQYIEYEVEKGKNVIIEVEEATELIPASSSNGVIAKSKQNFEQVLETIGPITNKVLDSLKETSKQPHQINIEFGLKLGIKTGLIIAAGNGEANFKVSLTWKQNT